MNNRIASDISHERNPGSAHAAVGATKPQSVLPAVYTISPTKEFHEGHYEALCTNPSALVPSPCRLDHWRLTVGDRLWEERQREAKDANRRLQEEYELHVAQAGTENERLDRLNREEQARYRDELEKYTLAQGAKDAQRRSDQIAKKRRRNEEHKLRQTLADELDSQEKKQVIEAVLRDIAGRSRSRAFRDGSWPLWLMLLSLYFPMFLLAPAAGVPLLLVSRLFLMVYFRHLRQYRLSFNKEEHDGDTAWRFWTYYPAGAENSPLTTVYTPVHFLPKHIDEKPRETLLLGGADRYTEPEFSGWLWMAALVPGLSIIPVLYCCWTVLTSIFRVNIDEEAKGIYWRRRNELTKMLDDEFGRADVKAYLEGRPLGFSHPPIDVPAAPSRPIVRPCPPMPHQPVLLTPEIPVPPDHCYDVEDKGDYTHTLRGAMVYSADEIRTLARYDLFANNKIRPYFHLGDVPFPILSGESASILVMGSAGAGKTTVIRHLMSALTPLTTSQVRRIRKRSPDASTRVPSSSHEWSRSQVHQAVVYNAKEEYIPFLKALGFHEDVDLFILDPADRRCWCWDIARDINDRDSVAELAVLLTPLQPGSESKKSDEIWEHLARRIIEAVIISLRNAAFDRGEQPNWTPRDLREAVATPESLRSVLQFHDTPATVVAQLIELSDAQKSSIYMTATAYISKIGTAAERWEDARRSGRVLSLKKWAKDMPGTVVVLPDTQVNEYFNGPINQILFKAITSLFLSHEFSAYIDSNGDKQYHLRYIFIDEFGEAGRLPGIKRNLSQGRSFNVRTVAGVHQLSQVQEAYGEKLAASIVGHFPYVALLRTDDPDTADWMSKRIGDRLQSYDKEQMQYGVSNGQTYTTTQNQSHTESLGTTQSTTTGESEGSSNTKGTSRNSSSSYSWTSGRPGTHSVTRGSTDSAGTNESTTVNNSVSSSETAGSSTQHSQSTSTGNSQSQSNTKSENRTHSKELRGERTVLPSEFLGIRSARKTKCVQGYYVSPDYPVWKAVIPFMSLEPILEVPAALEDTPESIRRDVQEDERVSKHKPWTSDDLLRLYIASPPIRGKTAAASQSCPSDSAILNRPAVRNSLSIAAANSLTSSPLIPADFDFA